MSFLLTLLACLLIAPLLLFYTLSRLTDPGRPRPTRKSRNAAHLLIVLGSGGHTAEMIAMLDRAFTASPSSWRKFQRRTWIVGSGDAISAQRAQEFEDKLHNSEIVVENKAGPRPGRATGYEIRTVPRAREIHQPLFTAPISSLRCGMACLQLLLGRGPRGEFPDVILCNGPATATIVVLTSVLLRLGNVRRCNSRGKMRTIYVESWARVKKLSLSGLILSKVVDRFLVQWPQLEATASRAEYIGVIV